MKNFICVYDFETDGSNQEICEPVQLASCMINPTTLDIVPDSEFKSYMRPNGIDDKDYFDRVNETIHWHARNYEPKYDEMDQEGKNTEAKKIFEKWKNAPHQYQVFNDFATYISKYNINQSRKSKFTAPVRAGHNILRFDDIILNRKCKEFKLVSKEGEQKIFNPRDVIDILQMAFYWFESLPEPKAYNMLELRNFFGMSQEGAHDALCDVRDEAKIIQKFMKLHRATAHKVRFKGAMARKSNGS